MSATNIASLLWDHTLADQVNVDGDGVRMVYNDNYGDFIIEKTMIINPHPSKTDTFLVSQTVLGKIIVPPKLSNGLSWGRFAQIVNNMFRRLNTVYVCVGETKYILTDLPDGEINLDVDIAICFTNKQDMKRRTVSLRGSIPDIAPTINDMEMRLNMQMLDKFSAICKILFRDIGER